MNLFNSMRSLYKNNNKKFLNITNIHNLNTINTLSNKHKQHSLMRRDGIITEAPDLTELNKQIFFPLTHLHKYRKESLINNTSIAYLNSVHPTKLRVNLNKTPSKKHLGLRGLKEIRVAPSNSTDVIYEYLKTFSKYSNKKNKKGVLINFNQHIAYNFNSKNLLVREVEPLNNNSLQIKTNKNKSTNAVPFTFSLQLEKAKVAQAKETENINKNININYPLNKPLLGLYPVSTKNTPRASFEKTQTKKAEEPNDSTSVDREISQDLLLRLNRINRQTGVSGETGYNLQGNNKLIKYSYKLLFYFFKSMYCLISKPVFIFTPDKVVIQIHYFLNIPKFKVFKLYSIFKSKKESQIKQKNNKRFN
jgi:hypothetical protein